MTGDIEDAVVRVVENKGGESTFEKIHARLSAAGKMHVEVEEALENAVENGDLEREDDVYRIPEEERDGSDDALAAETTYVLLGDMDDPIRFVNADSEDEAVAYANEEFNEYIDWIVHGTVEEIVNMAAEEGHYTL